MKKIRMILIALCLCFCINVQKSYASENMKFVDVSSKSWYYKVVKEASELGIMTGIDQTHFAPNAPMSRAMVASVLHRMSGCPQVSATSTFKDVKEGAWYENAVIWACENKIISGYNSETFGPNDDVTRQQMAVMMCNYSRFLGRDTMSSQELNGFKDYKSISNYALPAMRWIVENRIVTGTKDYHLNPQDNATRAECAKILLLTKEGHGDLSVSLPEAEPMYYWTPGGKSYHSIKDCPTLKRSTTIIEGELNKAIQSGKTDPCNICINN